MRDGSIITVTALDQTEVSFEVDRLFGINTPFINKEKDERFEVVIILKLIEEAKITILPVANDAKQLRKEWAEALEFKRRAHV